MQSEHAAPISGPQTMPPPVATTAGPPKVRPAGGRLRLRMIRILAFLPNLTLLVFVILAWQFASTVWLPRVDPYMAVLMPAPTTIAVTAAGMIVSGELLFHLMASLKREASAFLFAVSAIPLGLAMGWW